MSIPLLYPTECNVATMISNNPVSICLLTYNRADLLPQTLDSLIAQTYPDFDLILCDDCSTDNTEEVCRDYIARDKRIQYFRNPHNLGMPGNLNYSLQLAKGNYLANLHDGDIYKPVLIELWKTALDTFPRAGFVFNAYRSRRSNNVEVEYRHSFPPLIRGQELGKYMLSRWDSPVFGTVMARREVYERLDWFDPQFGNFSDVDMWLRVARYYDVAYVNEILIDLMPRDPSRFYSFVHWRVIFWLLGIHVANLKRFYNIEPTFVKAYPQKYNWRRFMWMFQNMLVCIKNGRWDRVSEGLAIWMDADDTRLRISGQLFGNKLNAPGWYEAKYYWQMVEKPVFQSS
jgi:glycosyltransferase involved in cell wall biosynthesis